KACRSICFIPANQSGSHAFKTPRKTRKFPAAIKSREVANWPSERARSSRLPVGCSVLLRSAIGEILSGREQVVNQLHGARDGLRHHLRKYQEQPPEQNQR